MIKKCFSNSIKKYKTIQEIPPTLKTTKLNLFQTINQSLDLFLSSEKKYPKKLLHLRRRRKIRRSLPVHPKPKQKARNPASIQHPPLRTRNNRIRNRPSFRKQFFNSRNPIHRLYTPCIRPDRQ